MQSAFVFFDSVVNLIIWAVILSAILSWLVGFNIINVRNRLVYIIVDSLQRITEPLLLPIRRLLPNLGGIDLSPIVLILLLIFFRNLVFEYFRDPSPVSVYNSRFSVCIGTHSRIMLRMTPYLVW